MDIPKEAQEMLDKYEFMPTFHNGTNTVFSFVNRKEIYVTFGFLLNGWEVEISFFYGMFQCKVNISYPHKKFEDFICQAMIGSEKINS